MRQSKAVTLQDVARVAGVSVQTASQILAKTKGVKFAPATVARVQQAAEEVGYKPNRLAQAMKRGRTHVIGVWVSLNRPVISYLHFLNLLSQKAAGSGYDLQITALTNEMAYLGEGSLPTTWPVDAVIAIDAGKALRLFREDRTNDDIPVLVMGLEEYANADSVVWNLVAGSELAVRNMIQSGAQKIIYVVPSWVNHGFPNEKRRRGYDTIMEEFGLEPAYVLCDDETVVSAANALRGYIETHGRPDGVYAFHEIIALGSAVALAEHPQGNETRIWGLSVTTHETWSPIPISTIEIPVKEVIDEVWRLLLDRIENPHQEHRHVEIPMVTVERDQFSS